MHLSDSISLSVAPPAVPGGLAAPLPPDEAREAITALWTQVRQSLRDPEGGAVNFFFWFKGNILFSATVKTDRK